MIAALQARCSRRRFLAGTLHTSVAALLATGGAPALRASPLGGPIGIQLYAVREDLQAQLPDWEALLSGFAMMVPPQALRRGERDVRLVLRDTVGNNEEVAFTVEVEPGADGPGPWQLRDKMPQAVAVRRRPPRRPAATPCPRGRRPAATASPPPVAQRRRPILSPT